MKQLAWVFTKYYRQFDAGHAGRSAFVKTATKPQGGDLAGEHPWLQVMAT